MLFREQTAKTIPSVAISRADVNFSRGVSAVKQAVDIRDGKVILYVAIP